MRERNLIENIASLSRKTHSLLKKGIGDDCAIFTSSPGADWLTTTDMLIENVHFDRRWHPPELLGRKSLAVSISDIAAMAGTPQFVLLSLGISASCDTSWLNSFLQGFTSQLHEHSAVLIGGDTVTAQMLTISVTVLGSIDANSAVLRSGAGVGDSIFVSGELGSAAAGLLVCQRKHLTADNISQSPYQRSLRCHLDPTPRVELAKRLGQSGVVTSLQDISDGIATDLSHICLASSVGARVMQDQLPMEEELLQICEEFDRDPVTLQLAGGEDYELLFTVKKGSEQELRQHLAAAGQQAENIHHIGHIVADPGVRLVRPDDSSRAIDYQGYEHRA